MLPLRGEEKATACGSNVERLQKLENSHKTRTRESALVVNDALQRKPRLVFGSTALDAAFLVVPKLNSLAILRIRK